MARYTVQIRSPKPPSEAFDYLADLRNFAEWDAGVRRVEQVAGDGAGPDTEFDVTVRAGLGSLTLRYRTISYDPPDSVVVEARSTFLTSLDTITVEPDGTGSVVTYDAELRLNGPLALGDRLLGLTFDRIGDRATAGLVRELDGERVAERAA
jgi:carbon monoxide dehydrogenase subunit G